MGEREACKGFWWGNLRERDHCSALGRLRRRWEDNIKMDLQEVGCGVWIGLRWFRIETGGCCNEPSGSIKCREFVN
jgi:hypothetical protein